MLNDDTSSQSSEEANDLSEASTPVKRGPGRPPGSLNKPKPPPLSLEEREALKDELAASYRQAVISRALAEARARGVVALIRTKLGKDGLAEIQAEVAGEHEARGDDGGAIDDGTGPHELAA